MIKYSDLGITTINNDLIAITMYSCFLKVKRYTDDLVLNKQAPLPFI